MTKEKRLDIAEAELARRARPVTVAEIIARMTTAERVARLRELEILAQTSTSAPPTSPAQLARAQARLAQLAAITAEADADDDDGWDP